MFRSARSHAGVFVQIEYTDPETAVMACSVNVLYVDQKVPQFNKHSVTIPRAEACTDFNVNDKIQY